jgi:hypothetical protein
MKPKRGRPNHESRELVDDDRKRLAKVLGKLDLSVESSYVTGVHELLIAGSGGVISGREVETLCTVLSVGLRAIKQMRAATEVQDLERAVSELRELQQASLAEALKARSSAH